MLLFHFIGVMSAKAFGTDCPMVPGEMPRRIADHSTFETSRCVCIAPEAMPS